MVLKLDSGRGVADDATDVGMKMFARCWPVRPRVRPLAARRLGTLAPLLANQSKLPRLPLPSLESTLERYLRAARPLVADEQFAATERLVAAALAPDSDVRALHDRLAAAEARPGGSINSGGTRARLLENAAPTGSAGRRGSVPDTGADELGVALPPMVQPKPKVPTRRHRKKCCGILIRKMTKARGMLNNTFLFLFFCKF